VLERLFDSGDMARYEVVGLSGTSGGAVCALLAWSALADGAPEQVGPRLRRFWTANSASTPLQRLVNSWVLGTSTLQSLGTAPATSPYDTPTVALSA
jgi:NTE family protein